MAPRPNQYRTRTEDARELAKEAVVPDLMIPDQIKQSTFINTNRLLAPESLTHAFGYTPQLKTFSDEEQLAFAEAFKHKPKEFGDIAALVPGRTTKECLEFYYANKSDGLFKTESKRQREAEKDVDDLELAGNNQTNLPGDRRKKDTTQEDQDPDAIPIDMEIERLRALTEFKGKAFRKGYPLRAMENVVLPRPDLSILRQAFRPPFDITDEQMLVWLRSADVLPLVKQWKEKCIDDIEMFAQLQRLLTPETRPWGTRADHIADYAEEYGEEEFEPEIKIKNSGAFVLCTNFAAKIGKSNPSLFDGPTPYAFPKNERTRAAVFVLFTAYDNLMSNSEGFFAVLWKSELAGLVSLNVRKKWEMKYKFEGEDEVSMRSGVTGMASGWNTQSSFSTKYTIPQGFATPDDEDQPSGTGAQDPNTDDELADTDDELAEEGEPSGKDGTAEHDKELRGLRAKAEGLEQANRTMLAKLKAAEKAQEEAGKFRDDVKERSGIETASNKERGLIIQRWRAGDSYEEIMDAGGDGEAMETDF